MAQINYFYSEELKKALEKENDRVTREWDNSNLNPVELAERQGLRFKKLFERFECDS